MDIKIEELKAQPVLCIRTKTSVDKLPQLIGESYMKMANYLQELHEQPAGVPYTAYFNMDMKNLDVELGFPVLKSLPGHGEIKSGELPAGRVASAQYKGPYSAMHGAYDEILKWIAGKGYQPKGVFYEYYYNSPQEVPESELLTKIVIPLK